MVCVDAKPGGGGADFFEDFNKGGDAWIALQGRCADERVRIPPKKIGVGMRDSREFPARHGMAAEEERPLFSGEEFCGGLGDADFGAAPVGNKGLRSSVARAFRK